MTPRQKLESASHGEGGMSDTFIDGTRSIVSVLRPKGPGWEELPCDKRLTFGHPAQSAFF